MDRACSLKALFSNYQAATLSYRTRTQYEGNNSSSNNNNNNTYFTGKITMHVAQIVNTEQLQYYVPQKCGLFQVYTVNTVQKGDTKDDDDDDDNNNNNIK